MHKQRAKTCVNQIISDPASVGVYQRTSWWQGIGYSIRGFTWSVHWRWVREKSSAEEQEHARGDLELILV